MRRVETADLVKYNANIRGKNVGDCVKRSLSLATGSSYNDISKELLAAVKERYSRGMAPDEAWKRSGVYNKVIKAHGGSDPITVDGIYTLEDFVDNVLGHDGTFLVTTGDKPGTHNHIVCVIDGKIYDSWNSKKAYAYKYYTFDGPKIERKSELDVANMPDNELLKLLEDLHYEDRLRDKASAMLGRKGYLDGIFSIRTLDRIQYKIYTMCRVTFPPFAEGTKERVYKFEVDIICTPFETMDSFKKLVDKAVDVRLYDRMYAVLQNEKSEREAEEVRSRVSEGADENTMKRLNKSLYMTTQERKFFNTLPGWARPLITYISVNQPGQYSDSYEIYMIPLPEDHMHDRSDVIMIRGYDASELRHNLQHYKETFEERDELY